MDPANTEFKGFYREAFPRIARFAMTLCLSEDEAFDLTQEARRGGCHEIGFAAEMLVPRRHPDQAR